MRLPLFLSCAFFLAVVPACSKKTSGSELPPQNVTGYWMGLYGDTNGYPDNTYNFLFRANGTVRVYESTDTTDVNNTAEGTYQVQGTTVTTHYTFLNSTETVNTTATLNGQYTFMQGSWSENGTTLGMFFLVRQLQ